MTVSVRAKDSLSKQSSNVLVLLLPRYAREGEYPHTYDFYFHAMQGRVNTHTPTTSTSTLCKGG